MMVATDRISADVVFNEGFGERHIAYQLASSLIKSALLFSTI